MQNQILSSQRTVKKTAKIEALLLSIFILIKLIICIFPVEYGYFRDELYFIELSHHLALGSVSVPPLFPWCLAILRFIFGGDFLFTLHLFVWVVAVVYIVLTQKIVKKLDGGIFAQCLALLCVTLMPLAQGSICTYDILNGIFWVLALYYLLSLLLTENKNYWLYIGVAIGLGLMAKFDILFLGAGIAIALILTGERKYIITPQLWLGALIALLIVSPYLYWIVTHDYLTIEYFKNYSKNVAPTTILEFLKNQIMWMNVLAFPVWFAGIYYFLFDKVGKKFRLLGIGWISTVVLVLVMHAKFYLISPYFLILFAGGGVFIEKFFANSRHNVKLLLYFYVVLIAILGVFLVPYVRPMLSMNVYPKYAAIVNRYLLNFHTEAGQKQTVIPQIIQDRFGWEEMAATISAAYKKLPSAQQKDVFILVENYGEASALDFYRTKYALPPVICGHLQYYLWIPKNITKNSVFLSINFPINKLKTVFQSTKQIAVIQNENAISYETNLPVYLNQGLKISVNEFIQRLKEMIM